MIIDENNLLLYFNKITNITSTEIGCTRFSYSKEDLKVRDILIEEMNALGMDVVTDFVGNVRAKFNPDRLETKSILIGSHIDTVKCGGKYDGLTGVLCSIEVIRYIKNNEIKLNHPVEVIIFSEEEGSNFGVTMIGSKYITKKINEDDLKNLYSDSGLLAYDMISSCGFLSNNSKQLYIDGQNEFCMIELHVEQGGILENENKQIGIVQAIAGMTTLQITVEGTSNHAGTTPMLLRRDPLVASAKIIDKISDIPKLLVLDTAVATVGKILVTPNSSNVIASKVIFNVDLRDVVAENINEMVNYINKLCDDIAVLKNVDISVIELGESNVVEMSDEIVNVLEGCAKELGLSYILMNSGAVHDNAMLKDFVDTGMIFVPSIKGISHSPYEDTNFEDIIAGANLLLKSVVTLGNSITGHAIHVNGGEIIS